jgi:hypothetical protein
MTVAVLAEREWEGNPSVFRHALQKVESRNLMDIQKNSITPFQSRAIFSFPDIKRVMWMSKWLPFPLLRICFNIAYSWSGELRSRIFGCATVNVTNQSRTRCLQVMTTNTFVVYPGIVSENGDVTVQVFVDHRVIDGLQCGRIMRDIEKIINEEIADEIARFGNIKH